MVSLSANQKPPRVNASGYLNLSTEWTGWPVSSDSFVIKHSLSLLLVAFYIAGGVLFWLGLIAVENSLWFCSAAWQQLFHDSMLINSAISVRRLKNLPHRSATLSFNSDASTWTLVAMMRGVLVSPPPRPTRFKIGRLIFSSMKVV